LTAPEQVLEVAVETDKVFTVARTVSRLTEMNSAEWAG
jgi:predicted ATPase